MRLKSRIDNIEKRLDQEHAHVWDEAEYQRATSVLQGGFEDLAQATGSGAVDGAEFLEAAEWIWAASIAAGRCTESELMAAADSLRAHLKASTKPR